MRPILVTAGATHNPIDGMRSITANATGKTGNWIANELDRFTEINLFGSALALAQHSDNRFDTEVFGSTRDLESKMKRWIEANPNGIVVHSAAVGDYEVANANPHHKISSGQSLLSITLTPAPKILPQLKQWSSSVTIVSFKAAPPGTNTNDLVSIARKQCTNSQSELVFANVIGDTGNNIVLVNEETEYFFKTRLEALHQLVNHLKSWI